MNDLITKLKTEYEGKKVLIVGLGLQGGGVGLAKFFSKLGIKVTVTDKKTKDQLLQSINKLKYLNVRFTLGKHKLADFTLSDVIFKAPKMRWDDPLIVAAQKKGVQIEMETSFFASLCPVPIIGITGTRGKSTTTMMIYELLKKYSGRTVHLAGNIPQSSTINLLSSIHSNDLVVAELSSWQLSGFHRKKISPHISVFTNFYPDHYDYYKTKQQYLYDKKAIYLYQKPGDFLVSNEKLRKVIEADKPNSTVYYFNYKSFPQQHLHLKGVHNLENASAAMQVGKILNLDQQKCIDTLLHFKGLPYRQEIVAKKDGIIFVNDTTSTTPTATIKAIETFKDHPIVLILGGNSKRLPTNVLIKQLNSTNRIVLLKGSFTDEILPLLKQKYSDKITNQFDNLEPAVKKAYQEAMKLPTTNYQLPTIILFSPAATSFAMFNNEFHRGDEFNKIVKHLK
ncbi:UDP-N-acetylmuramoyl-L-alanine--D-glutamate ligase [Candidatus Roizmanbacteria bacterium]|nr:UDP-N-acetylmuramoyl-L-alanine--D-glutamate ligase [Candidatus Roizmanbacteria bacterium]